MRPVNIKVEKARKRQLRYVWARMRDDDKKEMLALPFASIDQFFHPEAHAMCSSVNGTPAFCFGHWVRGCAVNVWGFGTRLTDENASLMGKYARAFTRLLAQEYPGFDVIVAVHMENKRRFNWHKNLGFREAGFEYSGLRWLRYEG
ncbi:MAG TPA: hypothetical protein VM639_00790 [Dongiaceae bacterium]|nr:hypothetical protein [Dongiaceae bacterium]